MDIGLNDLLSLNSLLLESHEAELERNNGGNAGTALTPGSFGAPKKASSDGGTSKTKNKDPKDIWDEDEVPLEESILLEDVLDSRPRPRYEILYKQMVGSEDVFLGLGDRSPSSADCSHMTVKIHFPGHSMKDLDLDVTKNKLRAESTKM
jgi:dynein assembly factor 6, axonemal